MAELKKEFPRIPKLLRGSRFSFAVLTGMKVMSNLEVWRKICSCIAGLDAGAFLFVCSRKVMILKTCKGDKKMKFYVKSYSGL